jgi:transposase
MIDALDVQLAPLTKELRAYARRQPGCRALMGHYGIGELTAVTILAELVTRNGSRPRARRSATPGWTSPCTSPTATRARASVSPGAARVALGAV